MSDDRKKLKPALRIVKENGTAEAVARAVDEAAPPKPKSRIAQMMAAYADAIDRDIKLLLDL